MDKENFEKFLKDTYRGEEGVSLSPFFTKRVMAGIRALDEAKPVARERNGMVWGTCLAGALLALMLHGYASISQQEDIAQLSLQAADPLQQVFMDEER